MGNFPVRPPPLRERYLMVMSSVESRYALNHCNSEGITPNFDVNSTCTGNSVPLAGQWRGQANELRSNKNTELDGEDVAFTMSNDRDVCNYSQSGSFHGDFELSEVDEENQCQATPLQHVDNGNITRRQLNESVHVRSVRAPSPLPFRSLSFTQSQNEAGFATFNEEERGGSSGTQSARGTHEYQSNDKIKNKNIGETNNANNEPIQNSKIPGADSKKSVGNYPQEEDLLCPLSPHSIVHISTTTTDATANGLIPDNPVSNRSGKSDESSPSVVPLSKRPSGEWHNVNEFIGREGTPSWNGFRRTIDGKLNKSALKDKNDDINTPHEAISDMLYGPTCNHLPFLEGRALLAFLPFIYGKTMASAMEVCTHWFMRIQSGLARLSGPITDTFIEKYREDLQFIRAFPQISPLQTASYGGVRLDWILVAQILQPACDKLCSVSYSFSCHPSQNLSENCETDDFSLQCHSYIESTDAHGFEHSSSRNICEGNILAPANRVKKEKDLHFTGCFDFSVHSAGSNRRIWLMRDMCYFHGDEIGQATVAPVGPVNVGDCIEIAVPIYSGAGITDLNKFIWLPIQKVRRLSKISDPRIPIPINNYLVPIKRVRGERRISPDDMNQIINQLSKQEKEIYAVALTEFAPNNTYSCCWYSADEFRLVAAERIRKPENLSPLLSHIYSRYTGVDVVVRKSDYRAAKPGDLGDEANRLWGIGCEILPDDSCIVHQLTRRGLLNDRTAILQLRVGDILEVYTANGGPE